MSTAPTASPEADDPTREGDIQPVPRARRVRIEYGGLTHPGKVRGNNEDQFLIAKLAKSLRACKTSLPDDGELHFSDEEGYLLVVADGMGGAAAGERASALAVETVETFVLNAFKWFCHLGAKEEHALYNELRQSLERADQNVIDRAQSDPRFRGMGTTLTMAYSVGADLYVVHAGDSRAYLFHDGELRQLTSDHTLVQIMVSGGMISPEDAKHHARRNVVTNVIGGPHEGVDAEIHKVGLADGDLLLLCSDGLTEPVDDAAIAEALARHPVPDDACHALIQLALDRGAPDNVTAIVARYRVA